ncbi:MAG: hypothetical protein FD170_3368 [Bacteroidetes bacterium]|nr:MAG: hypothetical protein FD170_3368 [Bacteroidota bacterium]
MSRKKNLDKFQELMFRDMNEITGLTPVEVQQLRRYRFAFTMLLDNPSLPDNLLKDHLIAEYDISESQAYRDLSNMKVILPNIKNAGKEWIRYIVNEELKEAIGEAKTSNKLKERILAVAALAKYNRLDQLDEEEMPWDEIIPVPIEPTNDPTVLGVKPLENRDEEVKRLIDKYRGEIEIEDIEYQDLNDEPGEKENIF